METMRHPWRAVVRRGRQGVQAVSLAVEALAANAHHFSVRVSRAPVRLPIILALVTPW